MITIKKILIVIFLFATISTFLVFKLVKKNNKNILLLGNYYSFNNNLKLNKNTNTFFYEKISYKELYNNIIYNDYVVIKNKNIYLNQLIAKSKYIIININDIRKDSLNRNKDSYIYLEKIINRIKIISNSKIIIIDYNIKNINDKRVFQINIPNNLNDKEKYEFIIYNVKKIIK